MTQRGQTLFFEWAEGETKMRRSILAITILFLSLTTHVAAQNRSPEEALKGLSEIGLVVKFGKTNGLLEAMRPNTLQVLRERARILLSDADIPFRETTDEAELAGRPRLVFTITLNKEVAPAIRVDSRVYERIRLWRDPAKEIDLATWVTGGIGEPTATQQMLFNVFDRQVNEFVKAYRAVNPSHQQVESRTPDPPVQLKDNGNALQGLNGTRVFVSFRPDLLADTYSRAELQKLLQKEAEKKFREAGIPLLKYVNETETAGRPLLYVFITLSRPSARFAPIAIESEFWQQVRPTRDPQKDLYAVTWESQAKESGPITDQAVLHSVPRQLDEFIKAYKEANPKFSVAAN